MTAALAGGPLLACGLLVAAVVVWPGVRLGVRAGAGAGPASGASRWSRAWSGWVVAARLRRRSRGTADGQALELIEALATQVRAGASPEAAWRQAHEVVCGPSAGEAPSAVSDPGSLPRGGPDLARDPAWRALGAAWRMSEQTGAPLADVLDRLAVGLRQEAEVDAEVEASLAAPRATARLLAGLPLVGVALGELLGARPLAVLVGTPVGRACGLGGLLLAVAGQVWTRALVAPVVRFARTG